ncbi:GNAT family N-acetyltransferase [Pengzhenrongella sicca]|uniref:GNAT family N-acetyltransferase n=1 Tax=Pengzhenrongella sicca TaxID=2819238 RepID=A0A8A4Z7Z5_9MICO|nr:GNAT family protein [Pengzhenrongella sicca]QTE28030.1 GNAT family N-acetyltransferase [Pengzhenrongella sicca]
MTTPEPPAVDLRVIDVAALRALLTRDLELAGRLIGAPVPAFFADEAWLWQWRLGQIEADPASAGWYVRAAVDRADGVAVGHAGFHGPPDAAGMVEIGYTVDPTRRGRGLGHAIVAALLADAARQPAVRVVRASVSPTNAASLALVRRAGLVRVGEQWDDEDGLEWVFERPVDPR